MSDGAQVGFQLFAGHADSCVGNRDGASVLVERHVNGEIVLGNGDGGVGEALEVELVNRVGRVGDKLAQEDFLVGVNGVDHQIKELFAFCFELLHSDPSFMACCSRLPVGTAAGCWAGRGWHCGGLLGWSRLVLRRAVGLVSVDAAAGTRCGWRGFEPRRCSWRGAELGVVPDVVTPVLRSVLHPRTASKRWFVAVRLRCRNDGTQAPINVISTPTCGVLIRILVCVRGLSRKEAFAQRFVTGLLLARRRQVQAPNRAHLRYRARAFSMVVRSASMTMPRNAPFSRTSRPRMVDPEGEHTSSFRWPG